VLSLRLNNHCPSRSEIDRYLFLILCHFTKLVVGSLDLDEIELVTSLVVSEISASVPVPRFLVPLIELWLLKFMKFRLEDNRVLNFRVKTLERLFVRVVPFNNVRNGRVLTSLQRWWPDS
jgi:hypothetical protein